MLTPIVKRLVEDQIKKLESNNEYMCRQIEFLAQRLDNFKAQLLTDTREVVELKSFLATLEGVEKVAQSVAVELGETRRGLSDPDDDSYTPKHTKVIVG
jgi:chromosome segregation ATPase